MRAMAEDRPGGRRQERATADLPIPRDDGGSVASDDEDSDGEFEFPSVSRQPAAAGGGAAAADELFAGGRIRAFYPVFGRVLDDAAAAPAPSSRAPLGRLFQLEQARTSSVASTSSSSSSSSASMADAEARLDGAPPDSYCLWTPGSSPASSPSRPPRKSGSTGSIARWRRIGELVVGRSHSDGKQKFLFLSAPPSPARDRDHHQSPAGSKSKPPAKGSKAATAAAATELDTVAAGRRMSYGGGKASPGGRRTFLPYRQDLVGLFANARSEPRRAEPSQPWRTRSKQ
ncbi:hypothetical protein SETIT_5G239900v2 [Setaria italica]|uniref:DUF1645 domain-containing protein n=1 Tax=Setaria italica TaxID=4555 RepID=K3XKP9_SETIT|nr:uncharacterized protein LOC101777186 [Setaria italica]RCV26365.1 hypothetical protein SETIT_5G239900v2 [Setaria italica]